MIDKGVIEQAYSFFHQKLRVYEFSHSDFLRSHPSFEADLRDAVCLMEAML